MFVISHFCISRRRSVAVVVHVYIKWWGVKEIGVGKGGPGEENYCACSLCRSRSFCFSCTASLPHAPVVPGGRPVVGSEGTEKNVLRLWEFLVKRDVYPTELCCHAFAWD